MNIQNYLDEHEKKSLLRVLTCGSVDDGKSTLIGRLLYDSKLIFTDQLQALKQASAKNGTTGAGKIDYALLLDGLKAEREQGITIDVAYRYFTTPKRKFIIADCPGHEQYTRNMATGASTADVAIILIDARHGILTQTKRHAYIVSLLGIKHLIVAVNKMDLFDYHQEVFESIKAEFEAFAGGLNLADRRYIPLSALEGENVVAPSSKISWYRGDSLLEILESIDTTQDINYQDFRFPVQYVIRPDLNFRGFAGSLVSGKIALGDEIVTLPSLQKSRVKRLVTADGDLAQAIAPQPVTLELEDEIDISSGDMIVKAHYLPKASRQITVSLIWLTEKELQAGNTYLIRHAGRTLPVKVSKIVYGVDINTLEHRPSEQLGLNQVGLVTLESTRPLYADVYDRNKATGSFILIDLVSHNTVGAGRIDLIGQDELSSSQDPLGKLKLETRRRHQDKKLLFGKSLFVSGQNASEVKVWTKQLDSDLFKHHYNSHYLGAEQEVITDYEQDTLIQIAQLLSLTGTLPVVALPKLPHKTDIKGLFLVQDKFDSLHLWLGSEQTAPAHTDVVISPSEHPSHYTQHLLSFLEEEEKLQIA